MHVNSEDILKISMEEIQLNINEIKNKVVREDSTLIELLREDVTT